MIFARDGAETSSTIDNNHQYSGEDNGGFPDTSSYVTQPNAQLDDAL